MNESIRLDRYRQAAPQLYELLREAIVSLALPPGTALVRPELAAQYGVSQTPVRDALMRLEEEGLVDVIPQAGTRVSKIDLDRAGQAHFLRRAIELELVRELAATDNAGLVKRLRAQLDMQQAQVEAADLEAFAAIDLEFHRELYAAANMLDLWQLVYSRSGHIDRLRRLHLPAVGKAQRIQNDHTLIVDAIAAGDPGLAEQRLREHLSHTLRQVDEIRTRHPEYFKA
ncbi:MULTISPECIES: GntR family transcriptional regulator [unclassified Achromobacter]|uniref:GntR family transcriptional regulator n=1 Tax=unclassified Achromobacter TaxID=2626865 RepID=UPI000B51DC6B|nr:MULTISPECIES: GntR family transcriptional regulator [unclassified Achromobacter]OWT77064.1 GntR family transcriptional regulator [Achromobacter sp. HZ28]OWT77945.1 GntR family transcriptional regulator [Achromobacter sp. HZ34]